MVNAANLETRLSVEPPAPPPAEQAGESRDADATQDFEPAGVNTPSPAPAADRIDISDAARAVESAPTASTDTGTAEIQPANADVASVVQASANAPAPAGNDAARQSSPQSTPTEPAARIENDPLASNQDSSLALEEAGNDTLNETEAGRTLGQVIDVFA